MALLAIIELVQGLIVLGALWIAFRLLRSAWREAHTPEGIARRRRQKTDMRAMRRDYGVKPRWWIVVIVVAGAIGYSFILIKQHG